RRAHAHSAHGAQAAEPGGLLVSHYAAREQPAEKHRVPPAVAFRHLVEAVGRHIQLTGQHLRVLLGVAGVGLIYDYHSCDHIRLKLGISNEHSLSTVYIIIGQNASILPDNSQCKLFSPVTAPRTVPGRRSWSRARPRPAPPPAASARRRPPQS